MPRKEYILSGYRGMWLFTMFDLPVTTKKARKRYAEFRKALIKEGFSMLQFSVYAKYCSSEDMAESYKRRIHTYLPPEGYVRLLMVTDRQFGKMESFIGENDVPLEKPPEQLVFF